MPGQWQGSTRRLSLPGDWASRRQVVLHRDGHQCTWTTDGARCLERATDVDHIRRDRGHELNNLRSLCAWHHARKSSAEGNASRARLTTRRATEQHPGINTQQPNNK